MNNKVAKKLVVAGGCFWCTESDFQNIPGVLKVISGFSGGHIENPSYEDVTAGGTGHLEAIEITYHPIKIDYRTLLLEFFDHIDPTDEDGQFYDRGESYTTAVFYNNEQEKNIADDLITELNQSAIYEKPIATQVLEFKNFYPAEEYHQDYHNKNPLRYGAYRMASGRDQMLKKVCAIKEDKGLVQLFSSGNKGSNNAGKVEN